MSFKKLNDQLKEAIERMGFEAPTPFQKLIIPKIKSGVNVFGIGPEGRGKSTALIISTLQKLNMEAFQDVPRALIFVKDKEAALKLEEQFLKFTRGTDLRVLSIVEEHKFDDQKDNIYMGVDIVIGTPKRISKLYFQEGLNLNGLQFLMIEDADFLVRTNFQTDIIRISQSLSKCQYAVFANQWNKKLDKLQEQFMQNAHLLTL